MTEDWLGADATELGLVVISALAILAIAILVIRIIGLRSLAKMSSFDFAVTIALGSIIGAVAATSASLWNGAAAFAVLLGAQWLISTLRRRGHLSRVVDNSPVLLMDGSRVLDKNLDRVRVTEADLRSKLREANVTAYDQVLAVVFEATGDISVLHGEGPLDARLLAGVRNPGA